MTDLTPSKGIDDGLPQGVVAYLVALQEKALQLEAVIDAVNAVAFDQAREDLLSALLLGAGKIAGELNVALDTVTVRDALRGAA